MVRMVWNVFLEYLGLHQSRVLLIDTRYIQNDGILSQFHCNFDIIHRMHGPFRTHDDEEGLLQFRRTSVHEGHHQNLLLKPMLLSS